MEHVRALVDHDATPRPTNAFEARARDRKAAKLADLLLLHGASSTEAAGLPVASRRTAAALAGVRNPSPLTWVLVCDLMACVERIRGMDTLAVRLDDALGDERIFARL